MLNWIKVADRVPGDSTLVIAGWKSLEGRVIGTYTYSDGKWWDGQFQVDGVTVWMPFPEMGDSEGQKAGE